MYKKIIESFRDGSLIYRIDDIDVNEYTQSKPDAFEAYMIAKLLQTNDFTNEKKLQSEFDNKIIHKTAYRHFFFYKYLKNPKREFKTKSGIPLEYYVPLEFQPINLQNGKKDENTLFNVIKNNPQIVIIGERGAGKTFSMEKILKDCLENKWEVPSIPIFIDLQGVSASGIKSRINKILEEYFGASIDYETLKKYSPKKELIFLFDGIDEMAKGDYSSLQQEIDNLISDFPGSRFVFTTRPLAYFPDKVLKLETYRILNLGEEQIKEIVKNHFTQIGMYEESNSLIHSIENNKRLAELATNPMLLTLICNTYDPDKPAPENEGEICDNFMRRIEKKDLQRKDDRNYCLYFGEVRMILENIAFEMYEKDLANIDREFIKEIICNNSEVLGAREAIGEIVERGFIRIIADNELRYGFIHKTWQTYFAASYLRRLGIEKILGKIKELVEFIKWDEVLLILAGMLEEKGFDTLIKEISRWDISLATECIGKNRKKDTEESLFIQEKLLRIACNEKNISPVKESAYISLINTMDDRFIDISIKNLLENKINEEKIDSLFNSLSFLSKQKSINIIVNLTSHEDTGVRERAIIYLDQIEPNKIINLIPRALNDESEKINLIGLKKVVELYSREQAEEILLDFLEKHKDSIKKPALELLTGICSPSSLKFLTSVLRDNNLEEIRLCAIDGLTKIESKESIEPLIDCLHDKNDFIRLRSLQTLSVICPQKVINLLNDSLKTENIIFGPGFKKISAFEQGIARGCLIDLIPKTKNLEVIEFLIDSLKDKSSYVRIRAVEKLFFYNPENIVSILIDCLSDNDKFVRTTAISRLSEIGTEEVIDKMNDLMKEKKGKTRVSALAVLGGINSDKALNAINEILGEEYCFIKGINFNNLDNFLKIILKLLTNDNTIVRYAISHLIFKLSNNSIDNSEDLLTAIYKNYDEIVIIEKIITDDFLNIGTDKIVDALIFKLKHKYKNNRYIDNDILKILRRINSEKVFETLLWSWILHGNVYYDDINALIEKDSERVFNFFMSQLKENKYIQSLDIMLKIDYEKTVNILLDLLESDDKELCQLAIIGLGKARSDEATDSLKKLLNLSKENESNIIETLLQINSEKSLNIIIDYLKTNDNEDFLFKLSKAILKTRVILSEHKCFEMLNIIMSKYENIKSLEVKESVFEAISLLKHFTGRRYLDVLAGTELSLYSGAEIKES